MKSLPRASDASLIYSKESEKNDEMRHDCGKNLHKVAEITYNSSVINHYMKIMTVQSRNTEQAMKKPNDLIKKLSILFHQIF